MKKILALALACSTFATSAFEVSDEPHLHFEIIKNNEQLNPELYIK